LQASTKIEFEEWKAALFYWHPPDDDIPRIDTLKISTPPPVMYLAAMTLWQEGCKKKKKKK
jgi:hypothetical protein